MAEPLVPLLSRKKLVGATEESTSGTFATVSSAMSATSIYDAKFVILDPTSEGERQPNGHYVGSVAAVIGKTMARLTWKQDLRPGDTFAALLTGCGYKVATATYKPTSDMSSRKTWSFKLWEGGRCKKMSGATGKAKITIPFGGKVTVEYEWTGRYEGTIDEAMPAQSPIATAVYMGVGLTLTLGGAVVPHTSQVTIDTGGNPVERESLTATLGVAHTFIEEIEPVITMDPEARLVAALDTNGLFVAGTTAAFNMVLTSGSNTMTIAAPAVQRTAVDDSERGKRLVDAITLACRLSSSGDDAISFVEA